MASRATGIHDCGTCYYFLDWTAFPLHTCTGLVSEMMNICPNLSLTDTLLDIAQFVCNVQGLPETG